MIELIKIFNNKHEILDELTLFGDDLSFTHVLNNPGRANFSISLNNPKCNEINVKFFNHIEFYDNKSVCKWGGFIADRTFSQSVMRINCIGYMGLLKYNRCVTSNYPELTYTNTIRNILIDANNANQLDIVIGSFESNTLLTTRKTDQGEILLDRIQSILNDTSYDYEVDLNRQFNFYVKKGSNKDYYVAEHGGEGDNILDAPDLAQNILEFTNDVFADNDNESSRLTSRAVNQESINEFGRRQGVYSSNSGITIQSTLDNYVTEELEKRTYPFCNTSFSLCESKLCPFDDISVGDSISVVLHKYFNYQDTLRIIEMTYKNKENVMDITVGQTLYRPAKPQQKLFSRR